MTCDTVEFAEQQLPGKRIAHVATMTWDNGLGPCLRSQDYGEEKQKVEKIQMASHEWAAA